MLFLYWPNTILPYKMAAVEQETYGNKLAPHVVYTPRWRCICVSYIMPTRDVQRITKILHNGSESGSEWARDLATYVYGVLVNQEREMRKWEIRNGKRRNGNRKWH